MVYKYFNIDNCIESEIKQYVISNFLDQNIFFNKINVENFLKNCKNFNAWLKELNLECRVIASTKILPNTNIGIHRDQNKNKFAMNFGILNYENSPILLYKIEEEKVVSRQIKNTSVFYDDFSESKIKLIDKIYLTNPVIWDTTIPHSIEHISNNIRMTLSVRFLTDISVLVK